MSGLLFDGNDYVSPIHINDEMMIGCTYQFLVDVCKANGTYEKGVKRNPYFTAEDALRKTLREHIAMIVENTWEEFELVVDRLADELKERYE